MRHSKKQKRWIKHSWVKELVLINMFTQVNETTAIENFLSNSFIYWQCYCLFSFRVRWILNAFVLYLKLCIKRSVIYFIDKLLVFHSVSAIFQPYFAAIIYNMSYRPSRANSSSKKLPFTRAPFKIASEGWL